MDPAAWRRVGRGPRHGGGRAGARPRAAPGGGRLGEAALPSNPLAALAEVETRWFTTATCRRCAYIEFYDAPAADVLASWAPTLSDMAPR